MLSRGLKSLKSGYLHVGNQTQWPSELRRRPAIRRRLLIRCALVTLVLGAMYLAHLHHAYSQALLAKYSPTRFDDASQRKISHEPWQAATEEEDPDGMTSLRRHQQDWKRIGGGFEGEVFAYDDTVIKKFIASRSPPRNCMKSDDMAPARIPTEMLATFVLGGSGGKVGKDTDFVPLKDYFLTPATGTQPASWHLLTPFLPAGNLAKLAESMRPEELSHRELDARFRPSLNRMLGALEKMHAGYGLCHDDIKPGNIFVADNTSNATTEEGEASGTRWLLADFGNVRQVAHPYHSSRIWTRDSRQHADCRVNDAVRLVKTYLVFLRLATGGGEAAAFDRAFWVGIEPWSQLYWAAVRRDPLTGSTAAGTLRERSLSLPPIRGGGPLDAVGDAWSLGCVVGLWCPAQRTQRELRRGMWISEGWARLFGLTRLFGVPTAEC